MNVAVLPARGGSKRIPRKNVRDFCGLPMISWSIKAALASECFDRIVVSTDDLEIAEVSRQAGAEVPFMRPDAISDDFTGTAAVVKHAIEKLNFADNGDCFVCCIYATAPFLDPEDLRRGLAVIRESAADFALSVTTYAFPIERALCVRSDGLLQMLDVAKAATRSQDLEERFHDAGQFYWGRRSAWLSGLPVLASKCAPVELPRHRVQDIDTSEDWVRAEMMFKARHIQPKGNSDGYR